MACCDKGNEYQTVVVWIEKSGSTMRVYLRNQGPNTVMIQRINLCFTDKTGPGYGAIYWRPEKNVEFLEAFCGVGETNVYVAAEKSEAAKVMKQTATLEETVTLEEVSLAEATKLS